MITIANSSVTHLAFNDFYVIVPLYKVIKVIWKSNDIDTNILGKNVRNFVARCTFRCLITFQIVTVRFSDCSCIHNNLRPLHVFRIRVQQHGTDGRLSDFTLNYFLYKIHIIIILLMSKFMLTLQIVLRNTIRRVSDAG